MSLTCLGLMSWDRGITACAARTGNSDEELIGHVSFNKLNAFHPDYFDPGCFHSRSI